MVDVRCFTRGLIACRAGAFVLLVALAGRPLRAEESLPTPVWPGATWAVKSPEQVGLDAGELDGLRDLAGGRGCVVRRGYLAYRWGDVEKRGDVASAAKPLYTHLLLVALESRKIASLDEKVVRWEPRLAKINASAGAPDRSITWRHLVNQTSCYGLAEKPGTAFAYNDWQMALFWDCLLRKVYGAKLEDVDSKVLAPLLSDRIGCEDRPTMLAFGPRNRAGRLAISPRDFARFGLLYLRGGVWGKRRLISPESLRLVTSTPVPNSVPRAGSVAAEMIEGQRSIGSTRIPDNQTDHMGSYSYLWWTNGVDRDGKRHWSEAPNDAFGAFGHGGVRAMVVIPSLDLIVSWNDTRIRGRERENEAFGRLVRAVRTTR